MNYKDKLQEASENLQQAQQQVWLELVNVLYSWVTLTQVPIAVCTPSDYGNTVDYFMVLTQGQSGLTASGISNYKPLVNACSQVIDRGQESYLPQIVELYDILNTLNLRGSAHSSFAAEMHKLVSANKEKFPPLNIRHVRLELNHENFFNQLTNIYGEERAALFQKWMMEQKIDNGISASPSGIKRLKI